MIEARPEIEHFSGTIDVLKGYYEANVQNMRRYCARLVGVDAAEDVVQEAMVKAINGAAGFSGDMSMIPSWLYRIMTNAANDSLRKRRSAQRWFGEQYVPREGAPNDPLNLVPSPEPAPHEAVLIQEQRVGLVAAINRLESHGEFMTMHMTLQGYEPREIAAFLDEPNSNRVRRWKRNALIRLSQDQQLKKLR